MNTIQPIVAMNIRLHRAIRGWSQEVLAELSGIHKNQIGNIERCVHDTLLTTVEKIADALEIPITDLFLTNPMSVHRMNREEIDERIQAKKS